MQSNVRSWNLLSNQTLFFFENVVKQIDYLISEAKYGPLKKNTAVMEKDIFLYLLNLKELLIGVSTE
jgi:hypothetical protein